MNTQILSNLEYHTREHLTELEMVLTTKALLVPLIPLLSDEVSINAGGCSVWFHVSSRSDLMVLMRLAPVWAKSAVDGAPVINYEAEAQGVLIRLIARDAALPGTCHVEEREVEVAAVPARMERRLVVVCDGASAEVAPEPSLPEAAPEGEIDLTAASIPEAVSRAIERDEDTPF